jgi:hypothetical protein
LVLHHAECRASNVDIDDPGAASQHSTSAGRRASTVPCALRIQTYLSISRPRGSVLPVAHHILVRYVYVDGPWHTAFWCGTIIRVWLGQCGRTLPCRTKLQGCAAQRGSKIKPPMIILNLKYIIIANIDAGYLLQQSKDN